jgi:hypothetical protein
VREAYRKSSACRRLGSSSLQNATRHAPTTATPAAATHDFLLWIQDLSRLDEIVRLPLCMPLFGCHLNFLPFLTSGIVRGRIRR